MEEVANYRGRAELGRLAIKPGLTGLWQVSGRSDLTWDGTVGLEVRYLLRFGLAQDCLIALKTFKAVFEGIY